MSKFVIQGQKPLRGTISVSGAKNSALKIMAASILSEENWRLTNVPEIAEVSLMAESLRSLGAKVEHPKPNEYILNGAQINQTTLDPELTRKFRSSILLVAPLLARFREVEFGYPGGCVIGPRPINFFLDGYRAFGARIEEKEGMFHLSAPKIIGTKFVFPWVSHTVTESLIMLASLAEGSSTLINAAAEIEVVALADFLNECGAKITGQGTAIINIEGVKKIGGGQTVIIPDRQEAGTFAILGALAGDGITIENINPDHLEVFLKILEMAGIEFERQSDSLFVSAAKNIKPTELRTHEYPGFSTDLQPPFTLLMTQAQGASLIHETIYEGRLLYADLLNQMGAKIIMCDPHRVVVNGPTRLCGRRIIIPDLRAGITMLIAALIASGASEIENIYQIDRGYESIEKRLANLGASISRQD